MNKSYRYDAIVVGAGPAGLTAGIYLSRAKVKTLLITDGMVGGQMILTHAIANYPGVESLSGYKLAEAMKKQANNFGADIKTNAIIKDIVLSQEKKQIILADHSVYSADAIILATGGHARALGVKNEDLFKGKGISYCATCDGDFFTDKEIVVVGGGNSALEEAVALTKYASKVTVVHQFDHFQAFEHAITEAKNNPKINFLLESKINAFYGEESIKSVDIEHVKNNNVINLKTDGVFIFIGYVPNTSLVKNKVELNQWNEIVVRNDMATNIQGVYAAGDCINKKIRQITTAVSDGAIAALSASDYINNLKKIKY